MRGKRKEDEAEGKEEKGEREEAGGGGGRRAATGPSDSKKRCTCPFLPLLLVSVSLPPSLPPSLSSCWSSDVEGGQGGREDDGVCLPLSPMPPLPPPNGGS